MMKRKRIIKKIALSPYKPLILIILASCHLSDFLRALSPYVHAKFSIKPVLRTFNALIKLLQPSSVQVNGEHHIMRSSLRTLGPFLLQ
jgi:hypothetical protein